MKGGEVKVTIRKRIIISNILMVIIPIILTILVFIGGLLLFVGVFQDEIGVVIKQAMDLETIQKMSSEYKKHLLQGSSLEEQRKDFEKKCRMRGYSLEVIEDGEVKLSNMTEEEKKLLASLEQEGHQVKEGQQVEEKHHIEEGTVFYGDKCWLVKNTFTYKDKEVTLRALKTGVIDPEDAVSGRTQKYLDGYVKTIGLCILLILIGTNGVLASRLSKSLLTPLSLLSYGSRQIKEGNLDFEMDYRGKDEFGTVCKEFDEMRLRLKQSVEMQIRYEENRKELMAGISHDLRTPLTAIKGYVRGLQVGIANTPEKTEKYLDTIYSKACEMDRLVDKLFLFSKLDAGHYPFHFEEVGVKNYLDTFFEEAREEFRTKALAIDYKNDCSGERIMKLDVEEMGRVFTNILENSVKYNTKPERKMHVRVTESKETLTICLNDNGPGVPPEVLKNLFLSFYRGDASRTKPQEGSGLGLAIAEKIVTAHGGTIRAANNEGLLFSITLPFHRE